MLKNKLILFWIVALFFLIGSLNFLAFNYYWYWRIWWFDLLMHFLGGMAVAVLITSLYYLIVPRGRLSQLRFLGLVILGTLVVGILWEVFEFGVDAYWSAHVNIKSLQILQAGSRDTLSDLLFDLFGALIWSFGAYYFNFFPTSRLEENQEKYANQ